jgi:acyl-CoA reductase-like NAD-dependent aldehyde dehydrogenase
MTEHTYPLLPEYPELFIGGGWRKPIGSGQIAIVSAVTEQVVGYLPEPGRSDVDAAVGAARDAFDRGPWPRLEPAERAAALRRIQREVEKRAERMAEVYALELGAPLAIGRRSLTRAVDMLGQFAAMHDQTTFEAATESRGAPTRVIKEPVGVVAGIIPWNSPVAAASFKLGPALLAGCTIVLKPAPEGPLTTMMLADAIEAAGLPPGVVSILPAGREIGEYLVSHPGVDKVAFTGSTDAGKRIMALCSDRLARVTLELGGKSAAIIAPDAELSQVLPSLIPAAISHSGQICAAITRVLVPRERSAEVVEAIADTFASVRVGDPFSPDTILGPLAMQRQRDRVEGYIARGRAQGARLVVGGKRPAGLDTGWYIEPTLFADVDNSSDIAQDEIFGPVTSVVSYDGIDNAIDIANDSRYGLSGAVYTQDMELADRVVRGVRTGQIFVNNASVSVTQPFGGFKQSGIGREGGLEGLAAYQETKIVQYG